MSAEEVPDNKDSTTEQSEGTSTDAAHNLVPFNASARRRGPGRPRKIDVPSTSSELEYNEAFVEQMIEHREADEILRQCKPYGNSLEVLRQVRDVIVQMQSDMEFKRIKDERQGKDTTQLYARRLDALSKIANLELEIRKIGSDTIDLKDPKFQKVFTLWIDTIRKVVTELSPPEYVDLFFNRLMTEMDGWEDRASDALR
jgi:hypothetical protein